MSTALTLTDGGLSISDVSFSSVADNFIIQNSTTGGNITIDNQDADKKVIIILEVMMQIQLLKLKTIVEQAHFSVSGDGGVAIAGNLTVSGNTTTTTNTVIQDKLIELANGTTGEPSGDSGIIIERGDSNNVFFGWDESDDTVIVGTGSFTGESTGDLTITDAAFKCGL